MSDSSCTSLESSRDNLEKDTLISLNTLKRSISDIFNQSDKQEFEERPIFFVENPGKSFKCSLCNNVFRDPVISTCSHTFCRRCLEEESNERCCIDNQPLAILVPNNALALLVSDLFIHCRYGLRRKNVMSNPDVLDLPNQSHVDESLWEVDPLGCGEKVRLSERNTHEENCKFATMKCPNSPTCSFQMKSTLSSHLAVCTRAKCEHYRYGCKESGTRAEMDAHVRNCPFYSITCVLGRLEGKFSELQVKLNDRERQVDFLSSMLGTLGEKVEQMEAQFAMKMDLLRDSIFHTMKTELEPIQNAVCSMDPAYNFKCKGTFLGHQGAIWCLCVHGNFVFSGSNDLTIKVWDLGNGYNCDRTLNSKGPVLSLTVLDHFLFSGCIEHSILVWDINTFELITSVAAHTNGVSTLCSGGGLLFSGSLESIKIWTVSPLKLKHEITNESRWVRSLVYKDSFLYSGSYQAVKIWELENFSCIRTFGTNSTSIYSIVVTGNFIIAGTSENTICVWNTSGTLFHTLSGHRDKVNALTIVQTHMGMKLLSGSVNGTIKAWSMDSLVCTQTLRRHERGVTSFVTTRGLVLSSSMDGTIRIWR